MEITIKNYKELFIEAGQVMQQKINDVPKLDPSWGIDPFVPDFIYKTRYLKDSINYSTRNSLIKGQDLLEKLKNKYNNIVEDWVGFYIKYIEDFANKNTEEKTLKEIQDYYNTIIDPYKFSYELDDNVLKIYDAFVNNKCYAFKYDW